MEHKTLATILFGEYNRYKATLARDRFGVPCVFIEDAEMPDEETGLPTVVVQLTPTTGYRRNHE